MAGVYETTWTNLHKHSYPIFLSYMDSREGGEREMKVKKENIRDVEEGRGIKEEVNMIRLEQMFVWKCHNDTLTLYCYWLLVERNKNK